MEKELLNLKEVCEYVGRNDDTMRKAIKNKEIPCIFFRGAYVFSKKALDLWALGLNYEEIKEKIIQGITRNTIKDVLNKEILTL